VDCRPLQGPKAAGDPRPTFPFLRRDEGEIRWEYVRAENCMKRDKKASVGPL
jgi:hypothetical protein